MASGLFSVVVVSALCAALAPCVAAWDNNCLAYSRSAYKECAKGSFCCGSCLVRTCCTNDYMRFSEDEQDNCEFSMSSYSSPLPMVLGIGGFATILLIFICCCVCPCCCLYKMCRKPRPVIATTTHTTVVTTAPQQYPRQPTATHGQHPAYQGAQYQPYQPVPVQQPYQPVPVQPGYGAQPMQTSPYHGQPFVAGPPPTYQEATGPGFPPNPMPYSQAAFTPGQPVYPLQPPVHPQPNAPLPRTDYLAQPAYNPDYTG